MSKELKESTHKIKSAFAPVELPPQQEKTNVTEVDIVDTLIIDTFETDDEGNVRPVTKQVVTGKKNRKEYIESFSDDCGIDNILKKIAQGAISEDKYSIFANQKAGQVTDLRGFEGINNIGDIEALSRKAEQSWKNLDPELKKNMSFKDFVSNFKNEDLQKYVDAKIAAKQSKEEGDQK